MARMGHDSERAAMIYQHQARGADKTVTNAIDAHIATERGDDDHGPAEGLAPARSQARDLRCYGVALSTAAKAFMVEGTRA